MGAYDWMHYDVIDHILVVELNFKLMRRSLSVEKKRDSIFFSEESGTSAETSVLLITSSYSQRLETFLFLNIILLYQTQK